MITARTVGFVCFVLLLGTRVAKTEENDSFVPSPGSTSHNTNQTTIASNSPCVCTPSITTQIKKETTKTKSKNSEEEGHCILFLPNKITSFLVAGALAVVCIVLLLTSLICACQICHLKLFMSRFKSHCSNVDLYAMKNRSESPCRDDGQAVMDQMETCPMLSVVTTQDENNKEESAQPNTEPPAEGPNGAVAQEEGNGCKAENQEPDVGAPEDSAIEV